MSNYTKTTNFTAKDSLSSGNPLKIVRGAEFDTEFSNLETAINTKADTNSPTLTGVPLAPTASVGTATTQLATTAFVDAERTSVSTLTNKTLTSPTINGGTITGITDLAVADGGTGVSTLTGIVYGNGTSTMTAATAAQVVAVINSTAVTNSTNSTQITNSGGWSVTPSGTKLYFNYNGVNKGSLDSSGNFIVVGDVTAYGTP